MSVSPLAALDDAPEAPLDPAVLSANLAALREIDPRLFATLNAFPMPADFRPVRALDGATTWRTEPPSAPAAWLDGTAIPSARARAVLANVTGLERGPALPRLGAGAELRVLLECTPPHVPVYVFLSDIAELAALLRVQPLHEQLRSRRCILISSGEEEAELLDVLERHEGLLPPARLVCPQGTPQLRIDAVRETCERAGTQIARIRGAAIEQLRAAAAALPRRTGFDRLALVDLAPNSARTALLRDLHESAAASGRVLDTLMLRGPFEGTLLPQARRLLELSPDLVVAIEQPASAMPLPLPAVHAEWWLDELNVPAGPPPAGTVRLAASPRVATALRKAGTPEAEIQPFYWAAPGLPADRALEPPADHVLVVGDLWDTRPAALGIDQPTHMTLWEHVRRAATEAWERAGSLQPEALFRNAERSSGLRLTEPDLRDRMLRLVEHRLTPAVILEQLAKRLQSAGFPVHVLGRGWSEGGVGGVQPIGSNTLDVAPFVEAKPPLAACFGGSPDPLSYAFLTAAAVGWLTLLHRPPGGARHADLGGVLQPRQHFLPFAGFGELQDAIRASREHAPTVQRLREQASRRMEQNTFRQRVDVLLSSLAATPPCRTRL